MAARARKRSSNLSLKQTKLRPREREQQPPPVKPPPAPECCVLSIVGCIEEVGTSVTAIKAALNVAQNLSVSATPSAQVGATAMAESDAAASADAAAVAPPSAGTPAAEADASAIPDSDANSNSTGVANTVTSSTLAQTQFQAQDLAVISVQYRLKWHVCNACGCVSVSGQVLDGGSVIYNFQDGEAKGEAGFLTMNVFPTTQAFTRGRFTLNLTCTDAGNNSASFSDTSPKVL